MATLSILFEAADDVDLVAITEALKTATRSQGEVYSRWITVTEEAEQAVAAAETSVLEREAAEQQAAEAREDAEAAFKEQSEAHEAAEAEREDLIDQLAEARGTTADLERERQEGIEAEEQARREREEREAAEREAAEQEAAEQEAAEQEDDASPEPEPEPEPEPDPPADSSAADRAVAFAYDQLGKPYEWAADGPDSFDCSGLTMRAWEQGGVSLAHWSVEQARTTARVSYANIQKGDLIFWSDNGEPSGTYHVAIYVGDGKMIQAPATGKTVEIQDVFYWKTPSFYGRVQT